MPAPNQQESPRTHYSAGDEEMGRLWPLLESRALARVYILRRRIEVAQAMMLTTAEPFRSIAMICGMCDQRHFTRSFRRIVGETPSMWRHTRRESLAKSGNLAQTIS
jgi:AraC-like DNA-binding protein